MFTDLLLLWVLTALQEGFLGTLSRTGLLTTGSYISSKKRGATFIGILPDSISASEHSRIEDILIYQTYLKEPSLLSLVKVQELWSIINTCTAKSKTTCYACLALV